ncbi:tetratricopeptide repeat protein [Echinicola strongylocentroti]|uniref:Tetratricopeptide repeat protein n=1 Tax=Echinicola strongylocentroti TaxID=1795355 RepID=A0A2Z4IP25_9BACT|nr:tetratricopeptide repeat protein [Echinicola strongylocentroti]AWW32510.1 tetratricopeptide repeat protein [Echinicola strongylocentroti]
MANTSRIELLQQFVKDEPDNPFNIYALALEYQNIDLKKAVGYFDQLLDKHPEYLPTYFHAAALNAEIEEIEKALSIYKSGIELAKSQNDQHALRELKNAFQNFLFENDLDE